MDVLDERDELSVRLELNLLLDAREMLAEAEPVSPDAAVRKHESLARVDAEVARLRRLLGEDRSNVVPLPTRDGAFQTAEEIMEREG